jgi:hypothetical protein
VIGFKLQHANSVQMSAEGHFRDMTRSNATLGAQSLSISASQAGALLGAISCATSANLALPSTTSRVMVRLIARICARSPASNPSS